MKTLFVCRQIILLAILAIGTLWPLQAQNPEALFQQGLMKEEGEGSLQEAIDIYIKLVSDESVNRPLQANAFLHMGYCYEKLGRTEARKTYRHIINNYPDQAETVEIAREKLALLSQSEGIIKNAPDEFNFRKIWEGPEDLLGKTSPDGRYITYVDWDTGDLALFEIATGKTERLTNKGTWGDSQDYAESSRWSPDGKQIVYSWWNEKDTYELRIIDLRTSESRVLYRDEEVNYVVPSDWSPDGKQILACSYFNDNREQAAILINVEDGSVRILKHLDDWPGEMCFSKDGKYVIYDHTQLANSGVRDIHLLPLDGGNTIPLLEHPADDFILGLSTDGQNLLFSSDRNGSMAFYILPLEGSKAAADPIMVRTGMDPIESLGFSTAGAFYYGVFNEFRDVYTLELDPGSGLSSTPPVKLETRFQGNNKEPGYSPDGKKLAYISVSQPVPTNINYHMGGGNVLIIRSLESNQEQKLIPGIQHMGYPRWTPDGKSVVVVEWCENDAQALHQINIENGKSKTIIPPLEGEMLFGCHYFTPDGKTMFYGRLTDNYRNFKVMSMDLDSGEEKMVYESSNILLHTLSPDGRWLSIISRPRSTSTYTMLVIPSSGGEARELLRFEEESRIDIGLSASCAWSHDGKYILFRLRDDNVENPHWELCRIPAAGGEIEKLGIKLTGQDITSFNMHPDGRHLSFSSTTRPLSPAVWVMENFLPSD